MGIRDVIAKAGHVRPDAFEYKHCRFELFSACYKTVYPSVCGVFQNCSVKMSSFNALPELVLSKNCAKYLLARNAGEKALFKKQSWLIDKARSKEEKAFGRERERLLQRRQSRMQEIGQTPQPCERVSVVRKISRTEASETDQWEVQSDTSCYKKQRRKQGVCLGNSSLWSSDDSLLLSASSANQSDTFRQTTMSQQAQENSPRSLRSLSCVLPPISLQRTSSARK